ncbi:carbonic anhydrase [Parvibaculum sp. MBR-TMA-1.3b-4.2]|jgi:carbonic anhydrase
MKTFRRAAILAGAVILLCPLQALAAEPGHWGYEGATGPDHWGAMSKDWAACATGKEQSPIDLTGSVKAEPPVTKLSWNMDTVWQAQNTGHDLKLVPEGKKSAGYIEIGGKRYELLQFRFHAPSEHTIEGKHAPMEVHFVHRAGDGELAVIGVMIEAGGTNGLFDRLVATAPRSVGEASFGEARPDALLPWHAEVFYRYAGSLTTPPCSETVRWTVLKEPLEVSGASIKAYEAMFAPNARAIQSTGRRYILESDD